MNPFDSYWSTICQLGRTNAGNSSTFAPKKRGKLNLEVKFPTILSAGPCGQAASTESRGLVGQGASQALSNTWHSRLLCMSLHESERLVLVDWDIQFWATNASQAPVHLRHVVFLAESTLQNPQHWPGSPFFTTSRPDLSKQKPMVWPVWPIVDRCFWSELLVRKPAKSRASPDWAAVEDQQWSSWSNCWGSAALTSPPPSPNGGQAASEGTQSGLALRTRPVVSYACNCMQLVLRVWFWWWRFQSEFAETVWTGRP